MLNLCFFILVVALNVDALQKYTHTCSYLKPTSKYKLQVRPCVYFAIYTHVQLCSNLHYFIITKTDNLIHIFSFLHVNARVHVGFMNISTNKPVNTICQYVLKIVHNTGPYLPACYTVQSHTAKNKYFSWNCGIC